ncbi:FecR family protein [Filimonas effusa]|nr:FecR family protein [Filimonas effusa]
MKQLLILYLENRCTPEQYQEVMEWLRTSAPNRLLLQQMRDDFGTIPQNPQLRISEKSAEKLREQLLEKVHAAQNTQRAPIRRLWQWTAAAAVIALIVLGARIWMIKKPGGDYSTPLVTAENRLLSTPPAQGKAQLTLANGTVILLDSVANGRLATQGNALIEAAPNRLEYECQSASLPDNQLYANTVSTQRGGQYQVKLSDGTIVWLNAASALKFPAVFAGNERRVELTGEAYFEVAAASLPNGSKKPFIVIAKGQEVYVTGTHFNIMAYNEEAYVKTTLLEGGVKVSHGGESVMLQPGQQSRLTDQGNIKVEKAANIAEAMAWKNGFFYFENESIETVMRQIARWYDVEVEFHSVNNERFYAQPSRRVRLANVLTALELTGKVHFTIQGKKIIVDP